MGRIASLLSRGHAGGGVHAGVAKGNRPISDHPEQGFEELSWRNWFLLSLISVAVTIGLGIALEPVFEGGGRSPWLWEGTEKILLVSLALMVSAAIIFLTSRQVQLSRARREMERLQMEARARAERNAFRLYALLNVSKIMRSDMNPKSVLHEITRICAEAFDCDWASLMLHDAEKNELVVESVSGNTNMTRILGTRQKVGKGLAGWAAEHRKALLLDSDSNLEEYLGPLYESRPISAAMVVPITHGEELVGVLNVSSHESGRCYDADDLCALQVFAENAGACIKSSEKIHSMRIEARRLQSEPAPN